MPNNWLSMGNFIGLNPAISLLTKTSHMTRGQPAGNSLAVLTQDNSSAIPGPRSHAWLLTTGFIVLLGGLRMTYLLIFPLDLSGTEACHWDWGRRPDWCYFSHPPMIGWAMNVAEQWFGTTAAGIRLLSPILGTISLALMALLARQMFNEKVALLATLLCSMTPANAALNIFLTIDAPLLACWTAALLCFWHLTESPRPLAWSLPLGIMICLGILTKQMMLCFPVLACLYLWYLHRVPESRKRTMANLGAFALAILIGLISMVPILLWNAQHEWITLQHTLHHFDSPQVTVSKRVGRFFEFTGSQIAIFSPLTWILLIFVMIRGLVRLRETHRRTAFLVLFSSPGLIAVLVLAAHQRAQPNWPAVYYISAFILLAAWLQNAFNLPGLSKRVRRWGHPAVITGTLFTAITYLSPWIIELTALKGSKSDPLAHLRGWKQTGTLVGQALEKIPEADTAFIVVLGHRYNASALAHYLPGRPRVYRFEPDGSIRSQYEVWPDPAEDELLGADAIIVSSKSGKRPPNKLRKAFLEVAATPTDTVSVDIGNGNKRSFELYVAHNLLEWPAHGRFSGNDRGHDKEFTTAPTP
jgi:4-amino-4-deoxy-L-arabinose transferase-like glycosyltransferase